MALSIKPSHLARYKDIARLMMKHGRGDLLARSQFDAGALEPDPPAPEAAADATADTAGNGAGANTSTPVDETTARAQSLADDLEAMGATFIKVGQFLSTRADLLPIPYVEALARLQDDVEPFSFAEVETMVAAELGTRLSKGFEVFEDLPLAAASLGQVHRAQLRSGQLVAVKVQRPGVREQIVEDLEVLSELAEFLDHHTEIGRRSGFTGMFEELEKSLLRELDYRQEARNLETLADHLADYDRLVVPRPVPDYVTSRVLTMEFVAGRKVTSLGPLAKLELDGAPLAEQLCRAYLQQILVDGFFHADPHPGNVLLTDDGRLALIDLGMVGQIAPAMQESLLKLVLAIAEGRGDDVGTLVVAIGTPGVDPDPRALQRRVAEMVLQFQGLRIGEIALGRLLFEAAHVATDHGYRMPRELTMLAKTLLNVDEVSRRLDPDFDPNAAIRRHASELMRQRMLRDLSPGRVFAGMLEAKEFAEKLPRRLNQVLDAVAENRVRIRIDALNEVLLMEGLQKIANRITLGLVIAAMIVGAALLMPIDTTFRILGYPGVAILFFIGAAVAGVLLASNILLHDLRAEKRRLRAQQDREREGRPA